MGITRAIVSMTVSASSAATIIDKVQYVALHLNVCAFFWFQNVLSSPPNPIDHIHLHEEGTDPFNFHLIKNT